MPSYIPLTNKAIVESLGEDDTVIIIKDGQVKQLRASEILKESSHASNKENPHEVSKTQVGLGNVPNVATNDQAPTYTEATELKELSSGEKLSVSFGKIAKGIKDLISHIGNTNNPHKVSASNVGLGNVPNVATNDQAPTYTEASTLTALTSGEKISTAFGKISYAVKSLINHLNNKENPHVVTKSQVGLGNVENKSSSTIRGEITKEDVTDALGYTPVQGYHNHSASDITSGKLSVERGGTGETFAYENVNLHRNVNFSVDFTNVTNKIRHYPYLGLVFVNASFIIKNEEDVNTSIVGFERTTPMGLEASVPTALNSSVKGIRVIANSSGIEFFFDETIQKNTECMISGWYPVAAS